MSLSLIACKDVPSNEYVSPLGKVLMGEHNLSPLPYQISPQSEMQNALFAITDGNLFFNWQLPDSSFIISKIEISKTRIRFDPTNEIPFVRFRWAPSNNASDLSTVFTSGDVKYVVINCKESDFPSNIKVTIE